MISFTFDIITNYYAIPLNMLNGSIVGIDPNSVDFELFDFTIVHSK